MINIWFIEKKDLFLNIMNNTMKFHINQSVYCKDNVLRTIVESEAVGGVNIYYMSDNTSFAEYQISDNSNDGGTLFELTTNAKKNISQVINSDGFRKSVKNVYEKLQKELKRLKEENT